MNSARKFIEEDFEVDASVWREQPSFPFAMESPCSFCDEMLSGESLRGNEVSTSIT